MVHRILTIIVIMGNTGTTLGVHGEVGLEILTVNKKHEAKHERVSDDQYFSHIKEVALVGILHSDNT